MPSALAAAEVATTPSAARSVWASPLYRGATAALFLSGLGTSAAEPQITLFLVNDLHVSLTTAGLFYLTNITAPLAGYLIGARSDRSGKRSGCSGGALWRDSSDGSRWPWPTRADPDAGGRGRRRIGMMHLMILGAAFGVGANLCFALTGDAAGMFAGQILMGGVWVCSRPWASSSPNDCCPKPSRPPQPSS